MLKTVDRVRNLEDGGGDSKHKFNGLGGSMNNGSLKTHITHQDVEKAMKHFFARGGKINILPQQEAISTTVIGTNKWGTYESLGIPIYE